MLHALVHGPCGLVKSGLAAATLVRGFVLCVRMRGTGCFPSGSSDKVNLQTVLLGL